MTIKKANILTMIIVFLFSLLFVALLVDEIYKDYEQRLETTVTYTDNKKSSEVLEVDKAHKLKSLLIKTVLAIVTLSFIIFAIGIGFYKILNAFIQRDTQTFLDFFGAAAHAEQVLVPQSIFFEDFRVMAHHTNKMLETINEQKKSLRELNSELEDRVKQKTADLQLINKNLEKEKLFSQNLLQAQKEFLRYTVHETNTPLSVILTSIELFEMKNKKDRQLSKIEAAVKNIFSIYDDLSYLVKKDQVQYPKSVINLEKYIGSRLDFFQEVAEQSLIDFEYKPQILDVHIFFNETKLQRIVDNTITNAIKYTLPKEMVTVTLYKLGAGIEMSVGSKSKLIENTDKVFEPYYRENETTKDGFGLGLQLVRSICEEEGVTIGVISDEKCTTFTYKFQMMGT